ncbi:hypothetical protein WDU94_002941 [Cyamophila willieti]
MGNHLVANRFKLDRKLGKGSFGDVYVGRDKTTREEVAIKFEPIGKHPQRLVLEKNFYRKVHGAEGVPHVQWYGQYGDYNALVMDLLGPSLEDLFRHCSKRFTLKTVLMLADDMIKRLAHVHDQGIVHRDIKPDNFLMGVGEKSHIVHLVDYGLATLCRNYVPVRRSRGLTGTARYASLNAHQGIDQAPRDDMEALTHTLIYFLKGSLPWQSIKGETDKQRADKIVEIKMSTPVRMNEEIRFCRLGRGFSQKCKP